MDLPVQIFQWMKWIQLIKAGFTLIELLVAISIIAVLTAILLPNFMGAREKAKDSQRVQDLYAIKNGLRLYYNDHQSYPTYSGSFPDSGCTDCLSDLVPDYIPTIAGIGYSYISENNDDSFVLWFVKSTSVGDDDTDSQTKCGLGTTVQGLFAVCAN